MTLVTIDVKNEDDLVKLRDFLDNAGFEYEIDDEYDDALEKSLEIAIAQSNAGLGRPHAEVMAEIRARYKR